VEILIEILNTQSREQGAVFSAWKFKELRILQATATNRSLKRERWELYSVRSAEIAASSPNRCFTTLQPSTTGTKLAFNVI